MTLPTIPTCTSLDWEGAAVRCRWQPLQHRAAPSRCSLEILQRERRNLLQAVSSSRRSSFSPRLLILRCTAENLLCPPSCSTPQSKGGGDRGGLRGVRRSSRVQEDMNKRQQSTIITLIMSVNSQAIRLEWRLHTHLYII